jgi:hypothetical protein
MTLIAGVGFDGVNMLLADVLLHNEEGGASHVDLPSGRTTEQIAGGQSFWLKQKIRLISDYLAVAYSTDEWRTALEAIAALKSISGDLALSSHQLHQFMALLKADRKFDRLSLIGLAALNDTGQVMFGHHVSGCEANLTFRPCFFAGTGAVDFASTVEELGPALVLQGEPIHRAVSAATSLISAFYSREIHSGADEAPSPLSLLYGGAWEHAYVDRGRIKKLGDTTHFFWSSIEADHGIEVTGPSLIVKRHYTNDVLVQRWLWGDGFVPWDLQKCIPVEPTWVGDEIGIEVNLEDPHHWPGFQSMLQVHDNVITWRNGRRDIMCWTNWGGDTGVRFTEGATGTTVSISTNTLRGIAESVTRAIVERRFRDARGAR